MDATLNETAQKNECHYKKKSRQALLPQSEQASIEKVSIVRQQVSL